MFLFSLVILQKELNAYENKHGEKKSIVGRFSASMISHHYAGVIDTFHCNNHLFGDQYFKKLRQLLAEEFYVSGVTLPIPRNYPLLKKKLYATKTNCSYSSEVSLQLFPICHHVKMVIYFVCF